MEIKKIIENGQMVEVKVFSEEESNDFSDTELKVKQWFDKEKEDGFTFLKCFRENGKVTTLFIKNEDLQRLLGEKSY